MQHFITFFKPNPVGLLLTLTIETFIADMITEIFTKLQFLYLTI